MSPRKAVIITGAGSGIGQATALEFARNGYFVYLLGRDKTKLEAVAEKLSAGARRYSMDLQNPEQIETVAADILSQSDTRIECLVNNAGIYSFEKTAIAPQNVWRETFNTNLFGAVLLTEAVLPALIKNKGNIVNVSSTLGLRAAAGTAAYSASKAALNSWTQSLALTLAPQGVRVNVVCPGIVDTPIHKDYPVSQMANAQPLGRVGKPIEIAKIICFLAGDSSSWTTGGVFSVDGGIQLT